ncbi:arylamine N-acetyltransferase [Dactylosporangium sp. NPDC048998]|uniref:arylamine N-acetyltransferase family protein n=1 Tax=Dactylosporangium sp. NPDC048998 TaxID=3363976 RepID=UPI00372347CB
MTFAVETYLKAIGYTGSTEPTLETLRGVLRRHLIAVPFDNSSIADEDRGMALWDNVDIDGDQIFDEIVVGGRGGVCYELNGLYRLLMRGMGFDYQILAGSVRQVNGGFGPELEHIFGCVRLDGEVWLTDVGLGGPTYPEPLRVCEDVQEMYGIQYQMHQSDGYWVVRRKPKTSDWQNIYRFRLQFRDIKEWNKPALELVEFPPELIAVGTYIRSRATEDGHLVLVGRRLLTVEDGVERVRVLVAQQELDATLADILHQAR